MTNHHSMRCEQFPLRLRLQGVFRLTEFDDVAEFALRRNALKPALDDNNWEPDPTVTLRSRSVSYGVCLDLLPGELNSTLWGSYRNPPKWTYAVGV